MDRITTFNPERLRWCLADRGETLEQCASGLGMSAESLAKVLAGEIGPTPDELRAMARCFACGLLFFIERGAVEESARRLLVNMVAVADEAAAAGLTPVRLEQLLADAS